MDQSIIIVGGGITGVCSALELQRIGLSVTLIERDEPGGKGQTSFGNAGILAREAVTPIADLSVIKQLPNILFGRQYPIYLSLKYLPKFLPWALRFVWNGTGRRSTRISEAINTLVFDTVERHTAFAKGTPAEAFIKYGPLTFIYKSKADYESDRIGANIRRERGVVSHELGRTELVAKDPNLSDRYHFGIEFPDHGWITNSSGYVKALCDHFVSLGGRLVKGTVEAIENSKVTLETGKVLQGDKVVLTTGAWSKKLAEQLGHNVPLMAERGYHLSLSGADQMPPNSYIVIEARAGMTPMGGFLRFAGQTEFAPLDSPENPRAIENLRMFIKRVYPKMSFDTEKTWMGTRPTLPDSLPMIGSSPNAPNVIFAFGSQHLGLTMGPKIASMVRDIVTDTPINTDMTPYAVNRFD